MLTKDKHVLCKALLFFVPLFSENGVIGISIYYSTKKSSTNITTDKSNNNNHNNNRNNNRILQFKI